MTAYIGWNNGSYSADSYTQEQLRNRWEVGYADLVFKALIGVDLLPYVGRIQKVFGPPQSAGLFFEFADGMRADFVRRIDPRMAPPKKLSMAMRQKPAEAALVPDNSLPDDPYGRWRNAAAMNGIGASFRQADTGTSLHVAFNRVSCDVHVDRNGFVMKDENGRVTWDLNGVLRHLTIDLAGDHAPWLMVSAGWVDSDNIPIIQATAAPWLTIDLPSKENGGQWEMKLGYMVSGRFDENRIINKLRGRR
jgi:hypothetical protein